MPPRIESLEPRTFLSASSLSADEVVLSAAITSLPALGVTDADTIRNDVAGQTLTKGDKALGDKWAKGVDAKYKVLLKADTAGTALINKDVAKLGAASSSKVTADAKNLTAAAGKVLAAIDKDSSALHTADVSGLTKIGEALPNDTTLQSGISTVESNDAGQVATIQADASTVFSTDVTAITSA